MADLDSAAMGWMRDLFGSPTEHREAAPVSDPLTIPSREASTYVTSGDALGLIAVYRAVSIRANAMRQLSLDVERGGQRIDTPSLLRLPDPRSRTPLGAFLEMTTTSRDLTGNAYWRIRRSSAGVVDSLEVLNPHDVTIRTNDAGRVIGYTHRAYDLTLDEVRHLPKLRVPGTPYGLGPIQAARAELRGAIDLRDYASGWINSGDVPSGILSTNTPLADDQAKATKARWEETRGGRRGVAILGSGLSYAPVLISPADAQFIESQQFNTTAIARLFGVPSTLMLAPTDGGSMTYQNVAQELTAFTKFGLADDIREIEDAFTEVLPRGQRARFNLEALLRPDTVTRYAAHASAVAAGWLLPSEVRAIENLDPIDGIDDRAPRAQHPQATASATKEAA